MRMISFFGKNCKLDQDLIAERHSNPWSEWFMAHCRTCKSKLIRYISDNNDPYFRESLKLRRQRNEYKKDLIQYGQANFKTFYKEQWEKFEAQKEDWEKAQIQKKKEKDEFYNNNKLNKGLAKKVLEIEERLEYGRR